MVKSFEDSGGESRRYAIAGAETGDPLVVIPGGPGFGFHYLAEPLSPLLGSDRRLIFFDPPTCRPAIGEETGSRCRFADFLDQVDELRRHLHLERVDLLAHSFGGLVALRYALRRQAEVGRVVLVESDPATWREWVEFRGEVQARRTSSEAGLLAEISAAAGWENDPALVERYFGVFLRPYFGRPDLAGRLRFAFDASSMKALRLTSQAVRADLGEWDFREDLKRVQASVLLIYGSKSVFRRSAMTEMRDLLPHSRLEVLAGVGHFPFLEAPGEFKLLVSRFLEGAAAMRHDE